MRFNRVPLLLLGALLVASCGAAAPMPTAVLFLLGGMAIAGMGGLFASGCRGTSGAVARDAADSGVGGGGGNGEGDGSGERDADEGRDGAALDIGLATDRGNPIDGSTFVGCGQGSLPADSSVGAGWVRCCLNRTTRLCPMAPPTAVCNYGFFETFCADGVTCGFNGSNPCADADAGTASDSSVATDAAGDVPAAVDGQVDASGSDATNVDVASSDGSSADVFLGCGAGSVSLSLDAGGVPSGWFRCCLGTTVRLCPPTLPTTICNYGLGQTFCADGVTCGFSALNPCGDGGAAETNL